MLFIGNPLKVQIIKCRGSSGARALVVRDTTSFGVQDQMR